MNFDEAPRIFIGIFWLGNAQSVVHKAVSLDKTSIIEGAIDYLQRLRLEDQGYAGFLKDEIKNWGGEKVEHFQTETGQIVLFSSILDDVSAAFT